MSNETWVMDPFFTRLNRLREAVTYAELRLATDYSEITINDVNLKTKFSRNVSLNIPIVGAPMDTVVEAKMAIALAKLGGLGIIHKNLSPKEQSKAVSKVKHYLNAFIPEPICVSIHQTVNEVLKMKKEKGYDFFSFPVKDNDGKIVGLVTGNDFDFCSDTNKFMDEIMSIEIIRADEGATVEEAYQQMLETRKKILPVFSKKGEFKGIYTLADVKRIVAGDSKDFNINANGNLFVGAALGVGNFTDMEERMELLQKEKVDVVVLDTARGDSKLVVDAILYCKKNYPQIDVVAGNISEGHSAKRLADAGVDGLRVGQGGGSICTTRIVAGIGCPQVSAVYNCARAIRGSGVPICADGGIEYSGDIPLALAVGGDNVMLGKLLAGTTESPGDTIMTSTGLKKVYRGMGSLEAMKDNNASKERYDQGGKSDDKLVPEGITGMVDFKEDVAGVIFQLIGGLKAGMGYLGTKDIATLQRKANVWRVSIAGQNESHPHGIQNIKGSPNYGLKS